MCKEKTSEDREELKLKTFTYKLDVDDDENADPSLNKPGKFRHFFCRFVILSFMVLSVFTQTSASVLLRFEESYCTGPTHLLSA